MCFDWYERLTHRNLTLGIGLWSLFSTSIVTSYSLAILVIPYDRWLSVYRDMNANTLTDFSSPSARQFTYHFAWTARSVFFASCVTLITAHILILAAGAR